MGAEPGFDITVTNRAQQSGFGGGLHFCLGHFVAATDMSVALPLLTMPGIVADGPGMAPVAGNTGPVHSRCALAARLRWIRRRHPRRSRLGEWVTLIGAVGGFAMLVFLISGHHSAGARFDRAPRLNRTL